MNKLKSKRGASIVLALLLLLVCVTVSSVILTASSVTSGQVSDLAEMDQRYYCVRSAAELLRDKIDGTETTITRTKTTDSTQVITVSEQPDGSLENETADPVYKDPVYTAEISDASSIIGKSSVKAIFGSLTDYATKEAWEAEPLSAEDSFDIGVLALDVTGAKVSKKVNFDVLDVDITVTLESGGELHFLLVNRSGSAKYALRVICKPDVSLTTTKREQTTDTDIQYNTDDAGYVKTVTKQKVETKKTELTWNVTEIETVNLGDSGGDST